MIKPYHLLIALLIGFGAGCFVVSCGGNRDALPDPKIHRLEEEIAWRGFKEAKIQDTVLILKQENKALVKDVITERKQKEKAMNELKQHRTNVPVLTTPKDTIDFLKKDTTLCDKALMESIKLSDSLNKMVKNDSSIIKGQGELIDSLQEDKKDLMKIDTLHQEKEKILEKKSKKGFWKGIKWGAIGLAILETLAKLALLL